MLKIVIGIVIALVAWVPLGMADARDIPFQAAIVGMLGTVVGGIVAVIGLVQLVRRALARPSV